MSRISGRRIGRALGTAALMICMFTSAAAAEGRPTQRVAPSEPPAPVRLPSAPQIPVATPAELVRDFRVTAPALAPVEPRIQPVAVPIVKTRAEATPASRTTSVVRTTYVGRNHMWMPALGINRQVYLFPCTRSRPPDNLVYRWGCAGRNNTWLLGHAWGVFKPLHDAYVQGRLRKGMRVVYADAAGRIHRFAITTWRVVLPSVMSWTGDMPTPTMFLQTCVGPQSRYRLNVKLVELH